MLTTTSRESCLFLLSLDRQFQHNPPTENQMRALHRHAFDSSSWVLGLLPRDTIAVGLPHTGLLFLRPREAVNAIPPENRRTFVVGPETINLLITPAI